MAELAALEKEGAELDSMLDPESQTPSLQNVDQADESSASEEVVQEPQQTDASKKESVTKTAQDKKDEPKVEEEQTDKDGKPLSKYQKAQAREAKAWQKIAADKEAVAKERAEIQAERQKIQEEREKAKVSEPAKPTPEQYEAFAKKAEADGEYGQAKLARQMAQERAQELAAEKAKASQTAPFYNESAFKAKQTQAFQAAVKEFPAIQDPNSSLAASVKAMATNEPAVAELLQSNPYGLYFVTKFAQSQASAALVPDLQKQVADLSAKIRTMETKTTPMKGASVNAPLSETRFEDLDLKQMEEQMDSIFAGR